MTRIKYACAAITAACCLYAHHVQGDASPQAAFFGIGDLPGGDFASFPESVSADGSVVVGASSSADGTEAFRWTAEDGIEGLGDLPTGSFFSRANAISSDGTTIVGGSNIFLNDSGREAFRWTDQGGMSGIGYLPPPEEFLGPYSFATSVSADGSVIVGESDALAGAFFRVGFYWTEAGGFQTLSSLSPLQSAPGELDNVTDVSDDGQVVVGGFVIDDGSGRYTGYVAPIGSPAIVLGFLSDTGTETNVNAVSGNGLVVVGGSDSDAANGNFEAFMWTEADGMQGLGILPGGNGSRALDVSEDGSVIVGFSDSSEGNKVFVWDEDNGMRSLESILIEQGLQDALEGWQLDFQRRLSLSADGITLTGQGRNPDGQPEGWVAVIPEPSTAVLVMFGGLWVLRRNGRCSKPTTRIW